MSTSLSVVKPAAHDEELRYEQLSEALASLPPVDGIRHLKNFLTTYPSFAPAHNDLGVLYLKAGNNTLALAHHEKATRLQPENVLFRKNLADFYAVELGWIEDAVDIYLDVLRRNPRDIEAMMALGKLGEAMNLRQLPSAGQLPELLQPCSMPVKEPHITASGPLATESLRTSEQWHMDAMSLSAKGEQAAAVAQLMDLVLRYPDNATAFNDLGILLQQQEKYQDARKYMEEAVRILPDSVLFRKNLADLLYVAVGDLEGAMKHYTQLLKLNPKDIEVLGAIAHICIDLGKLDDAALFLQKTLDVQPWDNEAREALGKIKTITAPTPVTRKSPEELYADAKSHLVAERPDDARKALAALVAISPDNAIAHNDLGVVFTRLGDYEEARRCHEKAVEQEPSNIVFSKNLADLYFTCLGRIDDAIFIYLNLLKSYPRDVETLTNLGHISNAVGRPEEAKTFYRRALEIEPWNREIRDVLQNVA